MRGPIPHFRLHVATAVLAIVVGGGFLVALMIGAGALRPLQHHYRVSALVPTASSLGSGASVRIAGLKVGRIASVEQDGLATRVEFDIDEKYAPIPADSRVGVRLRTLLGENYLEVVPGRSARKLAEGDTLPMTRANDYVEVDTILSTLQGSTRARAREFIRGLGDGLEGRGEQLNHLTEDTAGLVAAGSPLLRTLARDRRQTARLVDSFGSIAQALAERGDAVRRLAGNARTTFGAVASRDDALRVTLTRLPATLRQVRRTTLLLPQTSRAASPVLRHLSTTLADLRPAIEALVPASVSGRRLLAEVERAAAPLTATLKRVRSAAVPLAKVFPGLQRTLCQANPAIDYLAPFAPEAAGVFSGLGSAANPYDATGHFGRVFAMVSENSLVGYPKAVSHAVDQLMSIGLLGELHDLGYNAYPEQGTAGKFSKGLDATGPTDVTQKYPRIKAEC